MPQIKITKFETIPDGMYRFKVTAAELRTAENPQFGDGQFIGWQLLVMAGPNPESVGKMISNATGIQFGNKSGGYKFLRALGMPETDKVMSLNTDDYIGKEFVAKVKEKSDSDGNKSNKLEEFWSLEEYQLLQAQNLAVSSETTPKVSTTPTPVTVPAEIQHVTDGNLLGTPKIVETTKVTPPEATKGTDLEFPK